MKKLNVIFISPHFPLYFHNFCSRLKDRGVNVLGIGDEEYHLISDETKKAVTEYYKVSSLENFEEVKNACLFFEHKYGTIDWIESQNEYWLETEARLRSILDVNTGTKIEHMSPMKYKSQMKRVYESVGIPVARYEHITTCDKCIEFTKTVGYPIVVKPDNGVGASSTYKLRNDDEVYYFFSTKNHNIKYIAEEYINGQVETFDGITDSNKNILIASSHVMLDSIMDCVNEKKETLFYAQSIENSDIKEIGEKAVKAFDTRSRFFHFEFFRLNEEKEGLGKKGDLIGLEVNMRAPGAYIPDMINYTYDVDVYSIWSDMIVHNRSFVDINRKYYVGYTGRRNRSIYKHSMEHIKNKYKEKVLLDTQVPRVLAEAMGDRVILVRSKEKHEIDEIMKVTIERA